MFEESIAERTKLRRQKFDTIAKKKKYKQRIVELLLPLFKPSHYV